MCPGDYCNFTRNINDIALINSSYVDESKIYCNIDHNQLQYGNYTMSVIRSLINIKLKVLYFVHLKLDSVLKIVLQLKMENVIMNMVNVHVVKVISMKIVLSIMKILELL